MPDGATRLALGGRHRDADRGRRPAAARARPPVARAREHDPAQDRNFVRPFTSDYRGGASPSIPGTSPCGHRSGVPATATTPISIVRGVRQRDVPPQAGPEGTHALGEAASPAPAAPARAPSRRPASHGSPSTCGCSASWPSRARRRCRARSWPPPPASTRPSCARTSPTSARTASAASATRSAPLRYQLERALGLDHRQAVALVGIGNLGHALAGYGGFGGRGFPVTALFDVDPDLVGIPINGILVEHVRAIPRGVPPSAASRSA